MTVQMPPRSVYPSHEFSGTGRFQVVRRIGAGGVGVVYEVMDVEQQRRLALKTLRRLDAQARLRLKHEFRSLQDIHHPNLIGLGELHEDEGQLFFTMELVRGVDFLTYIQDHEEADDERSSPSASGPTSIPSSSSGPISTAPSSRRRTRRPNKFHEGRLRSALGQLAEAVAALHLAGKVHRDIKPSNVLITAEGRVVLLDFGMIADSAGPAMDASIVGTEHYMAPEQAAGLPAGPEADWYSVGVVLYRALTGAYPFQVASMMVMDMKQRVEPEPPSALVEGLPEDLATLCMELLRLDPTGRPNDADVLRRLGLTRAPRTDSIMPSRRGTAFVGRREELDILTEALAETERGRSLVVLIQGESGIGKSALMRRFLERVTGEADVLAGRCYERDAVPYKTVDEVIDELSRTLAKLGKHDLEAVLPPGADLLAELFPVLGPVLQHPLDPDDLGEVLPPRAQRAQAFAALRELLHRLRRRRRIVIAIDDLQWADADGLALLSEVLRPPDEPHLLFVATLRTGTGAQSLELLDRLALPRDAVWAVELGRMSRAESRALLEQLLLGQVEDDDPALDAILREAEGHPLFLDVLARERVAQGERAPTRLRDLLRERVEALDPGARQLLNLVAIAGGPIPLEVARHAAAADAPELARRLAVLRAASLVRTRGAGQSQHLELYHDRIREAATRDIPAGVKREWHGRLALALERAGAADTEALAAHWREAGDQERAFSYTARAAEQASRALAFERAATLYRGALALEPEAPLQAGEDKAARAARRRSLEVRLGDALSNAGRAAAAAEAYLAAAPDAPPDEAIEIRRRAVEAYLRAGYIDEGLAAAGPLLAAVNLELPTSRGGAIARLIFRRAQTRLRGIRFQERPAEEVDPALLRRIDVCWSVALGLGIVDPVAGAVFQAQNLLLSLDAGEPYRIARALSFEAGYVAAGGGATAARVATLLGEADQLARRIDHPHALGLCALVDGIAASLQGRWRASLDALDRAEAILRERCPGAGWERGSARTFSTFALWFLGDPAELSRRVLTYLREAEEHGDRYLATNLRTSLANAFWLLRGDPDAALREVEAAMGTWSRAGFHLQHYFDLVARAQILLYRGEGEAALQLIVERQPALERSLVLRIQLVRLFLAFLRGSAALQAARAASAAGASSSRLTEALRAASRIEGERMPWATPLALLLRAGAAGIRGEIAEALALLERAADGFDAADTVLYAAAARRRAGALHGGDEGAVLVAQVGQWMRQQGVADPDRLCAMLVPGF